MMMNLNSRMVSRYITEETASNALSTDPRRPIFASLHGGISVTREEHTDSLEDRTSKHHYSTNLVVLKGLTFVGKHSL